MATKKSTHSNRVNSTVNTLPTEPIQVTRWRAYDSEQLIHLLPGLFPQDRLDVYRVLNDRDIDGALELERIQVEEARLATQMEALSKTSVKVKHPDTVDLSEYKTHLNKEVLFKQFRTNTSIIGFIVGVRYDKRNGFIQYRIKDSSTGHVWGKAPKDVTFIDRTAIEA